MTRIFVRNRRRAAPGTGRPQFTVVAVEGGDLTFVRSHFRKSELAHLAESVGAEVVHLPMGQGEQEGGGQRHRRRDKGEGREED